MNLFWSARFADHVTPPGHPESPARADVMSVVASESVRFGATLTEPRATTEADIARVHSADHVARIAATKGDATRLDPDTFTSPESYDIALLAAGAAIQAADHALDRRTPALALVRPPGHHAERDRAMGFCLFNNVAVAAAHALARGVARVAIVDYDVHHGNGTQDIFYDDARVLYLSTHQFPFYPGTGAAGEAGSGAGEGFTVNVPVQAGATDADYDAVFRRLVVPVLDAFAPELLLISAGFDAHVDDPLAGMRLSTAGYGRLTWHLRELAARACEGRVALVAEGGYDLRALAGCLLETVRILSGGEAPAGDPPGSTIRAEIASEVVRAAQRRFWPTL